MTALQPEQALAIVRPDTKTICRGPFHPSCEMRLRFMAPFKHTREALFYKRGERTF